MCTSENISLNLEKTDPGIYFIEVVGKKPLKLLNYNFRLDDSIYFFSIDIANFI